MRAIIISEDNNCYLLFEKVLALFKSVLLSHKCREIAIKLFQSQQCLQIPKLKVSLIEKQTLYVLLSSFIWQLTLFYRLNIYIYNHLVQLTLTLQKNLTIMDTPLLRSAAEVPETKKLLEKNSRYYGLSLLRTPNLGPDGVRYYDSWLYSVKNSNTEKYS